MCEPTQRYKTFIALTASLFYIFSLVIKKRNFSFYILKVLRKKKSHKFSTFLRRKIFYSLLLSRDTQILHLEENFFVQQIAAKQLKQHNMNAKKNY